MNNQSLYRIGGAAVFVGIVLSIGSALSPVLLALGTLSLAVFTFALFRLYSPHASGLSMAGAAIGIVGAAVLAILLLARGSQNDALQNSAIWAAWFVAPLVFGYLAYQHSEAGMPRILGIIGMVGGLGGLVNWLLTMVGGGNWETPNNPALSPAMMGTYYLGMLFALVWMVWAGILLLRRQTQ